MKAVPEQAAVFVDTSDSSTAYQYVWARRLGIIQVACGLLAMSAQAFGMIVQSTLWIIGTGLWVGPFFIVAGSLGIASAQRKTHCLIVATMVLSIISAIVLMFIVIVAPLSIALTEDEYLDFGCNHRNPDACNASDGLLLVAAGAELVVAVMQAALCCQASCKRCCCPQNTHQVVYTASPLQHQLA